MHSLNKIGLVTVLFLVALASTVDDARAASNGQDRKATAARIERYMDLMNEAVTACSYDGMGWIDEANFIVEASWVNAACMGRRVPAAAKELKKTAIEKRLHGMTGGFNGCGKYRNGVLNFQPFTHANNGDLRANCVANVYLNMFRETGRILEDLDRPEKSAPAEKSKKASRSKIRSKNEVSTEEALAATKKQLKQLQKENSDLKKAVADNRRKVLIGESQLSDSSGDSKAGPQVSALR